MMIYEKQKIPAMYRLRYRMNKLEKIIIWNLGIEPVPTTRGNERIGEVGNKSTGDSKHQVHSIIHPKESIAFLNGRLCGEQKKKKKNKQQQICGP
jgi:hypothetical protein